MGKRTYTVRQGDSWERIAGNVYNDQRMFGELMRANGQIRGGQLRPGMTIYLPDRRHNPLVSNVQAALVGIPQNANYQLYNGPNAAVAQYDPTTRKFNTIPIGGSAAGTQSGGVDQSAMAQQDTVNGPNANRVSALNPQAQPPFWQHRRGGVQPTLSNAPGALPPNVAAGNRPGRTTTYTPPPNVATGNRPGRTPSTAPYSAVTPPTAPQAAGRPQAQFNAQQSVNPVDQQWIQKYYQQGVANGMTPSDALRWAQLQQQQNGGTGYVSPYTNMAGGGPYATIGADTIGANGLPAFQGNGLVSPQQDLAIRQGIAGVGQAVAGFFAPTQREQAAAQQGWQLGGVLNGNPQAGLNQAAQSAAQLATQAPTALSNTSPQYPGAGGSPSAPGGAYNYAPPAGASSASPPTGGSVVNTAIAPTVTAKDAVLKFQAAYADPNAMKNLPATLDLATLGGVAAANNMSLQQLTNIMSTKFGYTQAANGSWSRIGVAGGLDPLQSPTNDSIDTALPNATWAEASSMTNVPLGYGGPTFNYFGYSPTGRRGGSRQQYGAPIIWSPNSGDNP